MAETSTKPYLIRALYEWCSDNGYTPYIAVMVDERTRVPTEFVRNGEIVLNISPLATHKLNISNDLVSFQARFGGVARDLSIPVENVISIYARETGHGMAFEVSRSATNVQAATSPENADESGPASAVETVAARPALTAVPQQPQSSNEGSPDDSPNAPAPPGGRPRLKRVK